ncbi:hypothetical protein P3T73_01055 [Kiritimatiellota bacterium B12222]|nr:hypothetical protein P3T73_01055 [Kiritimatiellota bacterium B12222]
MPDNMLFHHPPLELTESSVSDARGTLHLDNLPNPNPHCQIRLTHTTPLMERLWRIALSNIEKNRVEAEGISYFGAGSQFGPMVYTRDISYSGILGLNDLYPDTVLSSIKHTRKLRRELGFRVSKGYGIHEIDVPWIEENLDESDYKKRYNTNSYTRRTDDVIWIWCAWDLFTKQGSNADWAWLYRNGQEFFTDFYHPFYDTTDGLYFGQASFIDIHFPDNKTSGYPQDWSIADCVLIKSLSTNCLYVIALHAMADAAKRLGKFTEAETWQTQCECLKQSIRKELSFADGSFTYFKDRWGNLQNRREALGSALVVISEVVEGDEAKRALFTYPLTDGGVPLFHPFFEGDKWYHNHSSWPFVDTLFIKALELSDGIDRSAQNAALLARTCVDDGSFHEVSDYRNREVKGSSSQLWTAASFIDLCRRGGLFHPS